MEHSPGNICLIVDTFFWMGDSVASERDEKRILSKFGDNAAVSNPGHVMQNRNCIRGGGKANRGGLEGGFS